MRLHNPSINQIKKVLDGRYRLLDKIYALIWSYMRACGTNPLTPEKCHKYIDDMLGNHGVESMRFKYRGQIKTLYYSNSGDTYTPTVMRWDDTYGSTRYVVWMVGCWGDIAENPNYRSVE